MRLLQTIIGIIFLQALTGCTFVIPRMAEDNPSFEIERIDSFDIVVTSSESASSVNVESNGFLCVPHHVTIAVRDVAFEMISDWGLAHRAIVDRYGMRKIALRIDSANAEANCGPFQKNRVIVSIWGELSISDIKGVQRRPLSAVGFEYDVEWTLHPASGVRRALRELRRDLYTQLDAITHATHSY